MTDINENDADINEVFDNIVFSEDKLIEEGYSEGLEKGKNEENVEGYHLGYHRGAEVGAELGYYLSVAESYLKSSEKLSEKVLKSLKKLVDEVNKFPNCNNKDVDILSELDNIRSLFKKTCALLKVDAFYPELDNLSF
ncbi:protein LTO1 homolog [Onthophagus taurus]|uniref:protein LTO1 homolog n=1 Tax=Onthophagus taurus TaxID=166361 RepID=UPI0039BDB461